MAESYVYNIIFNHKRNDNEIPSFPRPSIGARGHLGPAIWTPEFINSIVTILSINALNEYNKI